MVVGGRGIVNERAVVSTASYEAREFGIRSGMPLRTAFKKCPDAVFLPVDFPVYEAASAQVMATLRSLDGAACPWSWRCWAGTRPSSGARSGARRARRPGRVRRAGPGSGARGHRAALLGGRGQQQAPGQDRHRLRQAARGLHDHRRDLVRRDGASAGARCGASARRSPAGSTPTGSRRCATWRCRRPTSWSGSRSDDGAVVPPPRPRCRQQPGRRDAVGAAGARARGDLPARPGDGRRCRTRCACWRHGRWRASTPRAGRRCGCS